MKKLNFLLTLVLVALCSNVFAQEEYTIQTLKATDATYDTPLENVTLDLSGSWMAMNAKSGDVYLEDAEGGAIQVRTKLFDKLTDGQKIKSGKFTVTYKPAADGFPIITEATAIEGEEMVVENGEPVIYEIDVNNTCDEFKDLREKPLKEWFGFKEHWGKHIKFTGYIARNGEKNLSCAFDKSDFTDKTKFFSAYFNYNEGERDAAQEWADAGKKVVIEGAFYSNGLRLKSVKEYVETGIDGITVKNETANTAVYNLNGTLVNKNGSVEGLNKGIYIVNGKKVVVR